MDHGHKDHGGGHGDMDLGGTHRCNMNMLFTWDTTDLCIVFRSWHVSSTWSLIVSLAAVAALCAGYELLRETSRRFEASVAARQSGGRAAASSTSGPNPNPGSGRWDESSSLLGTTLGTSHSGSRAPSTWSAHDEKRAKVVKAVLYAVQVFYSFFIMLLFMTYNGWIMLAVAAGSFVGYLAFSSTSTSVSKTAACH